MAIIKRPDKRGKVRYQVRVEGYDTETFGTEREAKDYAADLRRKRKVEAATGWLTEKGYL